MSIPKRRSVGLLAIAVLISYCFSAMGQECKTKNQPGCQSPAASLDVATADGNRDGGASRHTKMEAWANVPGGTVWLEPGRTAYEHDTGLVRDLQTGQKSLPITPQSQLYYQPAFPPTVIRQPQLLQPMMPLSPMQPFAPNYPMPAPLVMPYRNPHYDVGPYGRYDSGRGAISSGRGNIAGKWQQVGRLPR